jgi:hypothetical protein
VTPRVAGQIHLLNLRAFTGTPLGETRSIDGRVKWLDNEQIRYALLESQKGSSASTDILGVASYEPAAPRVCCFEADSRQL